ncbi:MAG: bifunctional nuclease domain-containing protein, partial [Candidatus Dormibacteraceae bacterium]
MATGQHVVILKEKGAERYLPIWIGNFEANAIALK